MGDGRWAMGDGRWVAAAAAALRDVALAIAYRLHRVVQLGQLLREALISAPPTSCCLSSPVIVANDVALVCLHLHARLLVGHDLDHGRDGHSRDGRVRRSARHTRHRQGRRRRGEGTRSVSGFGCGRGCGCGRAGPLVRLDLATAAIKELVWRRTVVRRVWLECGTFVSANI